MQPILVISTIPVFTQGLVWAAAAANRPVWVITPQPRGTWRWFKNVLGVQTIDQESLVRADDSFVRFVSDFIVSRGIGVVVAADTRCSRFLLNASHLLPPGVDCFPMCEPEIFEELYDKWRFAKLQEKLSLPHPRTELVRDLQDVKHSNIEFPVVVKPTQGEGGFGIEKADTLQKLREIVSRKTAVQGSQIVIQSFVPGSDIDLSLLANRGHCVAWTIQYRTGNGVMRFINRPDILELGRKLVREIKYHGVMHLDMRIDERNGSVVLIESNPRFWGSLCYSTWAGVNFLELGLRMMDGQDISRRFVPIVTDCPYLAVTRRSLPGALLGSWTLPSGLTDTQRRSWRIQHGFGGVRGFIQGESSS